MHPSSRKPSKYNIKNIIQLSQIASGFGGDKLYYAFFENLKKVLTVLCEIKATLKSAHTIDDIKKIYDEIKITFNEEEMLFGNHNKEYNISELFRVYITGKIDLKNLSNVFHLRAFQFSDGSKPKFKTGKINLLEDNDIILEQGNIYTENQNYHQYPKKLGHIYYKSTYRKRYPGITLQ